ncbi:MAG: MFS transporter [Acidobacteriota bacterium]|nr:MFS transporter [Acidobacteriota bacterium]
MVETRDIRGDSAPSGVTGLPKAVVRLGWVSFLTDVSSEMIVPLLPAFLATLSGVPALALGWIEGVADATASFVKILSGRWTDRAKAKKPLVFLGYGLSSLARPLIGLAPGWPTVVLIRFFDRIGKGVRTAPRDTMIANAAPPNRRGAAFGLHRAFDNAGAVFGPLLAAGLVGWMGLSLRTVFLLAAIPAALSLLVLAFGVREEKTATLETGSSEGAVPSSLARELASLKQHAPASEGTPPPSSPSSSLPFKENIPLPPIFWRAAGVFALFALAASSDTFLLLKAKEIGIAAGWLPVLWAFSNAVKSLFSTWGGGLSDRFGRRRLLLIAWSLYAVCYAGFAFVSSAWPLVALVGVYSLYYSLSEGTEKALVADLVPRGQRGRAFGWMNGLVGFAALPASVGFGFLWQIAGSRAAFLTGAVIAGIAAAALLALRFPRPRPAG